MLANSPTVGDSSRHGALYTALVGGERERAAIYLSLHRGENYPALDVQLEETLR